MSSWRGRMLAARILVVVFALLAVVGLLAGFVRYQALDTDTFRNTAEELVANENVQDQIATTLVDDLYANVDVTAALEERLPADQKRLAGVLAAGAQELSYRTARRLIERPRVQTLLIASIEAAHRQLLRVLDDDLRAVSTEGGYVVLDLRPLVVELGDRIAIVGNVADRLPEDAGLVRIMQANRLETAQDITQLLKVLALIAWALAFAVAALAIWLAAGHRRTIFRALAVALVAVGLIVLVVRSVAGSYVVDALATSESIRPAAEDTWTITTNLLTDGAWTAIGVGLVALFGLWLTGSRDLASRARRWLAPYLARPELAFGAGALLLLLLVWWGPTDQTRRWQFLLVAAILLGIGIEVLRRSTAREFPEESARVDKPPEEAPAAGA